MLSSILFVVWAGTLKMCSDMVKNRPKCALPMVLLGIAMATLV